MRLLVGSLVRLLVGKSYHTKQKDGYSLPTNDPTSNRTNWIWMSKKIGLNFFLNAVRKNTRTKLRVLNKKLFHPIVYCIYLIQNELLVDLNKIGRK